MILIIMILTSVKIIDDAKEIRFRHNIEIKVQFIHASSKVGSRTWKLLQYIKNKANE